MKKHPCAFPSGVDIGYCAELRSEAQTRIETRDNGGKKGKELVLKEKKETKEEQQVR